MVLRVINSFHHLYKKIIFLAGLVVLVFITGGCEKKAAEDIHAFGNKKDVTEDLHHRLKAGMFDPGIDPFVCEVSGKGGKVSHSIVRVSWDRGSFRVRSDDLGHVVIYMDEEAIFSHVQMAPLKGFILTSQFNEFRLHPIR